MENYINIDGNKIYYKQSGSGPCVVLLHGIPTHSGLWDKIIPHLEKKCSVYAFDLLGFGKSYRCENSMLDIKSQSYIFLKVFKALNLNNINIIGHDIGGGIAQIIAISNPKLLNSMVLIDSACYNSWPIELLRVENNLGLLFEHLPYDVLKELFEKYMGEGLYNKDRAACMTEKYGGFLKTHDGIQGFLEIVKSFDNRYTMEISPMLDTLRLPVLILWGRHDKYIRLSYGYRLSEDIKDSRIKIVDNAGHFLPEDQPFAVSREIMEFLDEIL